MFDNADMDDGVPTELLELGFSDIEVRFKNLEAGDPSEESTASLRLVPKPLNDK